MAGEDGQSWVGRAHVAWTPPPGVVVMDWGNLYPLPHSFYIPDSSVPILSLHSKLYNVEHCQRPSHTEHGSFESI